MLIYVSNKFRLLSLIFGAEFIRNQVDVRLALEQALKQNLETRSLMAAIVYRAHLISAELSS